MIGHLGPRVSALLDGRLGTDEEERAWQHVHTCHQCRDQVEREGWIKTRLASLGPAVPAVSAGLKGSLLSGGDPESGARLGAGAPPAAWASWTTPPGEAFLQLAHEPARHRRTVGLAALGGGAVGAAMMGVLALGAAPASAPTLERIPVPAPTASVGAPGPTGFIGPVSRLPRR